jgi:hypothetical protein
MNKIIEALESGANTIAKTISDATFGNYDCCNCMKDMPQSILEISRGNFHKTIKYSNK